MNRPMFCRDSTLVGTDSTGAFLDADGEMTLHARDAAGTEFDFIYHFKR